MISIQLEGGKELEKKLGALGTKVGRKIVRQAVTKAQKPTLKEAQSNAKSMIGGEMGGLIAANIVLRTPKGKEMEPGGYEKNVRMKSESEGAPAEFVHITKGGERQYIPSAIEYGHGTRKKESAIPFMRRAAYSQTKRTIAILAGELRKGIDKIWKTG